MIANSTEIIMKPAWLESDQKTASDRKARVLSRIENTKNTDMDDDLDREASYLDLMESTGRAY